MKFKNSKNIPHIINGETIWESRSVTVVGVIFLFKGLDLYVLVSKRGPNADGYQGKMNLVGGYLDWNESASDALIRECWEETGFNLPKHINKFKVKLNNLDYPWSIITAPNNIKQNISLRFGAILEMDSDNKFPSLTTKHNEIKGEIENPMWLSINNIDNYEWAFKHDELIKLYRSNNHE